MRKYSEENERIKRHYFQYLQEAVNERLKLTLFWHLKVTHR